MRRPVLVRLYKVILALTSPDGLLARMPNLWSNYFRGVELAHVKKQGRSASHVVRHVGYYVLGAHAAGWLEFAYRKVGTSHPEVRCSELEQGNDAAKIFISRFVVMGPRSPEHAPATAA